MKTKKLTGVSVVALLLMFSFCLCSAFADEVKVSVTEDETYGYVLLAKGSFMINAAAQLDYKVITTIKQDGIQIYKEIVAVGLVETKFKRTGANFDFLVKLVDDMDGNKVSVRYRQ